MCSLIASKFLTVRRWIIAVAVNIKEEDIVRMLMIIIWSILIDFN
jgi:hypothetical protein